MKTKTIYQIRNRLNNNQEGAYSRAYHTEYEFDSASDARRSNVHDIYQNKSKYKIERYRVTYELIDDDVDNAGEVEIYKERSLEEMIEEHKNSWEQAVLEAFFDIKKDPSNQ